jgi:hypothetical protein
MNSVLAALIAGALAIPAAAQTTDQSATTGSAAPSTSAQTTKDAAANAKASKETRKLTTAEKNKAIKDINQHSIKPEPEPGRSVGDDPRGYSAAEIRAKAGRSPSKGPTKSTPENPTRAPQ